MSEIKRISVVAFLPDGSEQSGHLFTRRNEPMGFIPLPSRHPQSVDIPTGTIFVPFPIDTNFAVMTKNDPGAITLDVPLFAPRLANYEK